MLTTTVTQLRNELPTYLQYVQNGEHITITSHGNPIARILPLLDAKKEAHAQLQQLRKSCSIGDVISPIDTPWEVE